MGVTTKVQPIDRDLVIRLTGTDADRSAAFAAFARETLADAEATNEQVLGHVPPHHTIVDGVTGASEDQVRPDGVIVYEFELVTDALIWIGEQLELHSPVGAAARDPHPGLYQKSHVLFADGDEVPIGADVPPASQYVFVNLQPYARKLERLDSVYEGVASIAAGRFGNQAKITFGYYSVPSGAVGEYAQTASAKALADRHSRRGNRAAEWLTRQPAVMVSPR
jgi:hypothetical protein